jgi:hypothetical protein
MDVCTYLSIQCSSQHGRQRGHSTRRGRADMSADRRRTRTTRNLGTSNKHDREFREVPSTRTRSQTVTSPTETDVSAMVCTEAHGVSAMVRATSMHDDPIRQRLHALQPRAALKPRAAALSNRASSGATAVGGPHILISFISLISLRGRAGPIHPRRRHRRHRWRHRRHRRHWPMRGGAAPSQAHSPIAVRSPMRVGPAAAARRVAWLWAARTPTAGASATEPVACSSVRVTAVRAVYVGRCPGRCLGRCPGRCRPLAPWVHWSKDAYWASLATRLATRLRRRWQRPVPVRTSCRP